MDQFQGYINVEEISRSKKAIIYRAVEKAGGKPVILKLLHNRYPTGEEVSKFYREYDLLQLFINEGIIRAYEKTTINEFPAIVMEDTGGHSLKSYLNSMSFNIEEFLKLAIKITEIIGNIHTHKIIHKDINPSNIIWNFETDQVRIIDLGIATELPREITSIKNPNILEGTLAYISPEQTGRMNRSLDYRTDFYSLGVTFYLMLTGRLPFDSGNMLKLVHSHIAIEPDHPHDVNDSIPPGVSGIVMKLMAKNAEDRYHSAHGIRADLEYCLEKLQQNGSIPVFKLASSDTSDRFEISQKLYGREDEIETLMKAFDRAREGNAELMLVSGFSGIGKSVLINEIQRPVVEHRGHFFTGKFEQLKRDVPYSAIVQAFTALARQILGEGEEEITRWKEIINTALGPNGIIITSILPLFELIIGEQPAIPDLGPVESQNRFNMVFQNFIQALTSRQRPLVMFLDDLQWADSASLHLIELFITDPEIKNFLLFGAYRHNETPPSHPFMLTLDRIKDSHADIQSIFLQPLNTDHVNQLLVDTLNQRPEETRGLAETLVQKTDGNPFFVNEFIKSLYNDGLIEFSFETGWTWDMPAIERMQATDNVIDLVAGKIVHLRENSQEILKLAACLGSSFDIDTLVTVSKKTHDEILSSLNEVMKNGMLNRVDDLYHFSHDRVLEAAYSLIPGDEKIRHHHVIGNLVLENTGEEDLPDRIFYIVNQLNSGIPLVTGSQERRRLAELNLLAGKRAIASSAYDSALKYLQTGIDLLDENSWHEDYDFTLDLYQQAVMAAYLNAEYDLMDELAGIVTGNAEDVLDTVNVYETLLLASTARNQLLEGIHTGLDVVKKLGTSLPVNPGPLRIIRELLLAKIDLRGKSIDDLMNIPLMTDPHKQAVLRLLVTLASSSYIAAPDLLPLIILRSLRISVKNGISKKTPETFAGYGMIHCAVLGDIETGYKYGTFALRLMDKLNIKKNNLKALFVFWCMVNHWKNPIRDSLQHYLEAYQAGLETGDLEFAALHVNTYSCYMFYAGLDLSTVEKETSLYADVISKLNQDTFYNLQLILHQAVLNLQGKSDDPCVLIGSAYDQEKMLPVHQNAKDESALNGVYYFLLHLNYLFEKYDQAHDYAKMAIKYIEAGLSTPYVPLIHFYDSLVRLALYPGKNIFTRKKDMAIVSRNLRKMKKWADHCESNYSHKYHLMAAEKARVLGKERKAIKHYGLAAQRARENGFLHEEALSLELTGKFWLGLKEEKAAALYLNEARSIYRVWGATAKIDHLEKQYHHILSAYSEKFSASSDTTTTETGSTGSTDSIDLTTVIRTSQTLSSEIDLHRLLKEVMRLSIENAGAQRGFLILEDEKDNRLYIQAVGATDKDITVLESIPLENFSDISTAVVHYVNRTGENIVLNNACNEGNFTDDPYIKQNKVKSLLCTPVTHKGKTSGILYLENNITSNAFTKDRIELLQLISSQAAISIENARLLIDRQNALDLQKRMTNSFARFVPTEFLTYLNKESIIDVELGNQVQKQMSVLFTDIRSFTSLSENMTPQENFNFLNSYLKRLGPIIRSNGGFIDKYIGDAVMALFADSPENAIDTALMMQADIREYNNLRKRSGYEGIAIGIGIHSGNLMLGTIGEENRMEGTVISDDVNLASRIESLTKYYGADILISGRVLNQLPDKSKYNYRIIDTVIVMGRSEPVTLIEILNRDSTGNYDLKFGSKGKLVEAIKLYREKETEGALSLFQELSDACGGADNVYNIYIDRCNRLLSSGIPGDWSCVEKLDYK